jgi:hypothetical protein
MLSRLAGKKHPAPAKIRPRPYRCSPRFGTSPCLLSAHGTVALCGYRRANLKKEKEKEFDLCFVACFDTRNPNQKK